ncbi:1410_t:CDS:10, partial [Scutellospora calospora]
TCADVLSLIPNCIPFLNSFALASSSNAEKYYRELKGFTEKVIELVEEPYSKFINIGLPKLCFSLQLLGSAKKEHIKRPAISSINKGFKNFDNYLLAEEEFKPIDNNDALVKGANLAIAEYRWLQIRRIEKGFINFQVQSVKEYPIYDIKYDKDQLYGYIQKNRYFVLKESINVKEMEDALDVFSDFLNEEPSTTLIHSAVSYRKTLSNESEAKLKELEKFNFRIESILRLGFQRGYSCIAILDKANATMRQMASRVYTQESANAICNLLNIATHVVAIDAFANNSTLAFLKFYQGENDHVIDNKYQLRKRKIVKFLYNPNKGLEGIRRGFKILQEDEKQRQDNFANIDTTWSTLDCVIYTSTVEASIFFEISSYFDTIIGITNITTPVHIEAFAQILIASTEAILELILVEDTEKINRNKISHTIKNTEKKIKGADAESIANASDIKNLKIKEEMQWEDSRESIDPSSVDLHKFYLASKDVLLLFSFKTRAKRIPDLNTTIKFINAILSNWCGYTIRSSTTHVGSRTNRVWKKTYWIYRKPYGGDSFVTQEEITAIKDLFDSIPITNNITSECTKHEVSDLSNNKIDEKDLFLEMLAQYDAEHRKNSSQDICYVDITTFEANTYKKEIFDSLISLSSEFLIKSESDIDMLIFYLQ